MPPPYYAVRVGRTPGIYFTWEDANAQVYGFNGCQYKKFWDIVEADNFIRDGYTSPGYTPPKKPIKMREDPPSVEDIQKDLTKLKVNQPSNKPKPNQGQAGAKAKPVAQNNQVPPPASVGPVYARSGYMQVVGPSPNYPYAGGYYRA